LLLGHQNKSWTLLTNTALPTFLGTVLAILTILASMAIVDAAEGQDKVLFKLAAETGARAGELYALTVDDLLFGLRHPHQ
jgi:integrase